MSKTKMRCNTCGKWFQSANAKEVTCPDCVQKARKEKAMKNAPPVAGKSTGTVPQSGGATQRPAAPPPPKPKPAQSGTAQWLDTVSDVKVGQPEQPRPKLPSIPSTPRERTDGERREGSFQSSSSGPGNYRDRDERGPRPYQGDRGDRGPNYREGSNRGPGGYRERDNEYRGPGAYHVSGGTGFSGTLGQRPRQPMEGGPGYGPRPDGPDGRPGRYDKPRPGGKPGGHKPMAKAPKPASPPKPKKEKTPPPAPFKPTDEQIKQVEERYLELATPTEFDGIRTQIAKELSIPKTAVKKIVKELRDRQQIPSWWELHTYKGSEEELARIKAAYEPLLPVPDIGVHKIIAKQLDLKPGDVYQAIKLIRQEMQLPQYNDPSVHGLEPTTEAKEATTEPEGATIEVVQVLAVEATPAQDTANDATATPAAEATPATEAAATEEKAVAAAAADGEAKE